MKASIIGIGTEITSGQILNSNGQWISKKMTQLGVDVTTHICIPDDHKLIFDTLEFCKKKSDLIFITGGLGPTTDDFTRDVVAKWAKKKLVFDPKSLSKIKKRFKERGLTMREFQKQQCYYPKGSKILKNRMGTANAFYFQAHKKEVFVLPGPPREIEVIWNEHIDRILKKLTQNIDRLMIQSWKCVGVGESEVAHRVENALQGCSLTKGYRAHHPYVEVKLSYYKSQSRDAKKWIKKIDEVLQDVADPLLSD